MVVSCASARVARRRHRGERSRGLGSPGRTRAVALLGAAAIAPWLGGCNACSRAPADSNGELGLAQTTESILSAQSPACPACATGHGCLDPAQQGGRCELTDGGVPVSENGAVHAGAPLDPPPPGAGFTANCLRTLHDVFASRCAAALALTPCLCGEDANSVAPCLEGRAPPEGPLVADYAKSFGTARGERIEQNFVLPTFGAGQANGIVQCLAAFDCACCFGRDGGGC